MKWKDLVKKYGVKTAKKMFDKEDEELTEQEKEALKQSVKIDSIDFFKNEWLEKFELGEYKELLYEEKGKKFLVLRIK